MQSQHKTGNLVHVSPEDFDPYPGEFLKPDLDEKIYRSSMMLSSQYLANNDPDAAMEAMRNIYIAKHNAPPPLTPSVPSGHPNTMGEAHPPCTAGAIRRPRCAGEA